MFRLIDLIAIAVLGLVVLFPKPDLDAHPEFVGETVELDHIAALEDARFAAPTELPRVTALADAYLDTFHPDFALATLQHLDDKNARVQVIRATAYAERLEAPEAIAAAKAGYAACDADPKCGADVRVRLDMAEKPMRVLLERGIDPLKQPELARQAVAGVLHETHPGLPTVKAPPKTK